MLRVVATGIGPAQTSDCGRAHIFYHERACTSCCVHVDRINCFFYLEITRRHFKDTAILQVVYKFTIPVYHHHTSNVSFAYEQILPFSIWQWHPGIGAVSLQLNVFGLDVQGCATSVKVGMEVTSWFIPMTRECISGLGWAQPSVLSVSMKLFQRWRTSCRPAPSYLYFSLTVSSQAVR